MTYCIAPSAQRELLTGLEKFCARQRFVCLRGCIDRLAALIEAAPDQPVLRREATIRHIVAEHCLVHEAGDAMPLDLAAMAFDVRDLLHEMEHLRRALLDRSERGYPAQAPLMAG